ncbi:hypothetical protein M3603_05725 [Rummeliibacillus stabekisii]|uniref:hypothetical protein n=1 Tax=Rummeliibacillus stabekisii TaxID=241244 RepID=UPI00203E3143|nr:hypothetical protein [Rummeliibacillus stabekisii]MCM3316171.1 hypothetical protein [Rummeliibacillus stabekisii]
MKRGYLEYTVHLKVIGEFIEKIISLINNPTDSQNRELQLAISGYDITLESIKNSKPPNVVNEEHQKLVSGLTDWINAIKEANRF